MNIRWENTRSERGAHAAIVVVGLIMLLLCVATVVYNDLLAAARKAKLELIASEVANFAVAYLPDPLMAVEAAFARFDELTFDRRFPHKTIKALPNAKLRFYVSSALGDELCFHPKRKIGELYECSNDPKDPDFGRAGGVMLPIREIKVVIEDKFQSILLNLGTDKFTIRAEATSWLTPTDYVLVVENSNIGISPFSMSENIGSGKHKGQKFSNVFDVLPPTATQPSPTLGNEYSAYANTAGWSQNLPTNLCSDTGTKYEQVSRDRFCSTKAERYLKQCFGEVALNMKRAALLLYDYLSASATQRVSVIFTNTVSNLEQSLVAFPLRTHPTFRDRSEAEGYFSSFAVGPSKVGRPSLDNRTNLEFPKFGVSVDPRQGLLLSDGSTVPSEHDMPVGGERHEFRCGAASYFGSNYREDDCPTFNTSNYNQTGPFRVPLPSFFSSRSSDGQAIVDTSNKVSSEYLNRIYTMTLGCIPDASKGTLKQRFKALVDYEGSVLSNIPIPPSSFRYLVGGTELDSSGGSVDPNKHISLLPRETIWLKPFGAINSSSGRPEYTHHFGQLEFGIMRAFEVLRYAPRRIDRIPVRRRVIIVLSATYLNPANLPKSLQSLSKKVLHLKENASGNLFKAYTEDVLTTTPCNSPRVKSIVSNGNLSDPGEILNGVKLLFLNYGFTGTHFSGAPLGPEREHQLNYSDIEVAGSIGKKECNEKWSQFRGMSFFSVGPNSNKGIYSDDPRSYPYRLAALTARMLALPETVN